MLADSSQAGTMTLTRGPLAAIADAEGDRPDPRQRRVDGLPLAQLSLGERQVALADPLRLELSRELRIDVRPLRKEHHATRPPIEPLHEICGGGVSRDRGVEVRFVRMMHPLLDDDAGGLVDEDERGVLEEDVERRLGQSAFS